MKFIRSSKCSLKFATDYKRELLSLVLQEYGRVVNIFIDSFWSQNTTPAKSELLKSVLNVPETWLSARLRKVAAREALDMISSAKRVSEATKKSPTKPHHRGLRMNVSCTIAELLPAKNAKEFDAWLHLSSIGNNIIMNIPIRFHDHFNNLAKNGKRLNSYIISKDRVQFCFEIITEEKRTTGSLLGLDTGINALASLSDGRQFGLDTKDLITRINRCEHGSKGQQRARRALKQRMDEVAKEILLPEDSSQVPKLLVVEDLKKMNYKSKVKRRLNKSMRRSIGAWAYSYWLERLKQDCEWNRVSFRSVNPAYTSQECSKCGHTDRGNRDGEEFLCRSCGHFENADLQAARTVLNRFLTGPYGAGFKPEDIGAVMNDNTFRNGNDGYRDEITDSE